MKKLTVLLGILMIMIFSIGNAKMTKEEKKRHDDDVLGYLTAENVFDRIKKHWDKQRRYIGVIK